MQPVTRGLLTTKAQIEVNWLPLTTQLLTGNSGITSYQLVWDNNSGLINIIAVDSLVLNAVLVGLTKGEYY